MATRPMKQISGLPGLEGNTYTFVQLDDTLTTAGKAADAKKTGDELNDLKSALITNRQSGAFAGFYNLFNKNANTFLENTNISPDGTFVPNSPSFDTVIVPIPYIGKNYALFYPNSARNAYTVVNARCNMYDANGKFLGMLLNNQSSLFTPNHTDCAYCAIHYRKNEHGNTYPPIVIMTDSTDALPISVDAEYGKVLSAFRADTATNSNHATSADMATNSNHATSADMATNASKAGASNSVIVGDVLTDALIPKYYDGTDTSADFKIKYGVLYFDETAHKEIITGVLCNLGKRSDVENKTYSLYYSSNQLFRVALIRTDFPSWGPNSKYRDIPGSPLPIAENSKVEFAVTTAILDQTTNGGAFANDEDVFLFLRLRSSATDYAKDYHMSFVFWKNESGLMAPYIEGNDGDSNASLWADKTWAAYGDSITAITNGNSLDAGWAKYIDNTLGFSGFYGRGIGSQAFNWRASGGAACFINADGTYHSRNNSYNKDNYTGDVPSGTVLCRGAFCSWDRITHMFPASIKDTIDLIFIMGGTNDVLIETALEWVTNDTTDPEWAASSYYADYGGDYNINTLRGGVASTIMKFQAWMPNALIILGTPMNGQTNENNYDGTGKRRPGYTPDEFAKSKIIKDVAAEFGIPCVDVYAECGVNVLNSPLYITDGTHPYNEAGMKMLGRVVTSGFTQNAPRF